MARTTRELRLRRHARVRRKLSGTAARPRVAVSRTNKHISAQIIDDVAGRTLAASATKNGHRVYVVLLNDQNRDVDARALLDWAFNNHTWP